jgi:hypothetical protein
MMSLKLNCPSCGATQFNQLPDGTRDCRYCGTHYMLAVSTVPTPPPLPDVEWPPRVDPVDPEHTNEATKAAAALVVILGVCACAALLIILVGIVIAVLM